MDHTGRIVADFTETGRAALEEIVSLLQNTDPHLDLAVTRMESFLDAVYEQNALHVIPWASAVSTLVQAAIDCLIAEMEPSSSRHPVMNMVGRPKLQIPSTVIENLLGLKFRVPVIATLLGVSKETIFRRMKTAGLSVGGTYTTITDSELDNVITDILLTHPNTGYKRMKGFLQLRNIRVTDLRVRISLRAVDPEGVYQRTLQNRAIIRRQYFVQYSNQMWHLDTNMKLIRWGIVVRSCIDGKSRTVVYAHASGDNRAETNLLSFMGAVESYGIPLRTRSDKGGENVLIARYMIETRGIGRASHIAGRSVHNQRIERFWKDVFYGVLGFYYSVFSKLEDDNVLDIENPFHIKILHQIFLPRLCLQLQTFKEAWNLHPISTEGNYTPTQLMLMHLPPPEFDLSASEEDLTTLHFLCNTPTDLVHFTEEDSITTPMTYAVELPQQLREFISSLDPSLRSDSFGYNEFQFAASLV